MSIIDYVLSAVLYILILNALIVIIWRITCFFKKSCKWKKCPYRHEYHLSSHIGWEEIGCKKFPPTEEELEEEEKMLDKLEELIEQLKEENQNSK